VAAATVEAIVAVQPIEPPPAASPEPPAAPPVSDPDPVPVARHEPNEHVRVVPRTPAEQLEAPPAPPPEPEPMPEPMLEPVAERVPLAAVPEPEPEPEPAPAPVAAASEPEPQTVVPIGVSAMPRQWNLWDLERLTRESAGADAARDEERQFLLMYLREFADSAGLLPIDFDGLVRDSFGELVGTR
jgi:hypothetical protein